ncbi:MAG: S24 family peptidase [Endomicrobium sp.]|jgi:SOS-response transcriptional repressor LexA|nr:S24 family peptidase [Endomicrobium sp.]
MEPCEVINQAIRDKGIKAAGLKVKLESIIGEEITKSSFYQYMQGRRNIPQYLKVAFAKALDLPVSAIFRDKDTLNIIKECLKNPTDEIKNLILSRYSNSDSLVSIPVFEGVAGCGAEGYLEQLKYSENKIEIAKKLFPSNINNKNLSIIRIVGDSMSPYLEKNDWAIIQIRTGEIVLADGVYLIAHGQNVQIKRCQFKYNGDCILKSDNKEYSDVLAEAGEWDIIGKVVARLKMGSLFQLK